MNLHRPEVDVERSLVRSANKPPYCTHTFLCTIKFNQGQTTPHYQVPVLSISIINNMREKRKGSKAIRYYTSPCVRPDASSHVFQKKFQAILKCHKPSYAVMSNRCCSALHYAHSRALYCRVCDFVHVYTRTCPDHFLGE
jgi:hypothetical protein